MGSKTRSKTNANPKSGRDGLRRPRDKPKTAQDGPRQAQYGPRWAQDGPRRAQDRPRLPKIPFLPSCISLSAPRVSNKNWEHLLICQRRPRSPHCAPLRKDCTLDPAAANSEALKIALRIRQRLSRDNPNKPRIQRTNRCITCSTSTEAFQQIPEKPH